MDVQLKIIFGLQAFAAFIIMTAVIYFVFSQNILESTLWAVFATCIIAFWAIFKYKRRVNKTVKQENSESG